MLSGANEVAVEAFLAGRIAWSAIAETVAEVLEAGTGNAEEIADVLDADRVARERAAAVIERRQRESGRTEQQVKDPLEQVEVPVIRPRYWIASFLIALAPRRDPVPRRRPRSSRWCCRCPIIIFLHELAHFVTAKRSGMKVTEFFVGFGPRLWSVQKGETEYGLKAIPLGGYCKIIGMTNLEEVAPEDEPRAYRSKAYLPKVVRRVGRIRDALRARARS